MKGPARGRHRVRLAPSQNNLKMTIQGIPKYMAIANNPKRNSASAPDFSISRCNHNQATPMFNVAAASKKRLLPAIYQ